MSKQYNNLKILKYLIFYFGIMHFIPLLNVFLVDKPLKTFLFVDSVGIFTIFLSIRYIYSPKRKSTIGFSQLDFLVFLYILLSLFSVLFYFQPNNPASIKAYLYGIHHLVFPVFLYFSIKLLDPDSQRFFLKFICYLNLFFVINGLLLLFFKPNFYTNYLIYRFSKLGIEQNWQLYGRMQSYYGSTSVGNIAAITIVLIAISNLKHTHKALIFTCMIIAALLSQQRGGFVVTFLATMYYFFSKQKFFLKKIVVILFVIVTVLFSINVYDYIAKESTNVSFIKYSMNKISDIFHRDLYEGRLSGYKKGWNFFLQYPIGLGVGATTNEADNSGAHPGGQVVDANFMRMLADLGLEGAIIFILIVIFSLKSAAKREKPLAWLLLILIYCIQMMGTNVLDSFYISHTFWILLGIIDSKPYGDKGLLGNHINKTPITSARRNTSP